MRRSARWCGGCGAALPAGGAANAAGAAQPPRNVDDTGGRRLRDGASILRAGAVSVVLIGLAVAAGSVAPGTQVRSSAGQDTSVELLAPGADTDERAIRCLASDSCLGWELDVATAAGIPRTTVTDDLVILADDVRIRAVDLRTGRSRWTAHYEDPVSSSGGAVRPSRSPPSVAAGAVAGDAVVVVDRNSRLVGLGRHDGAVRWRTPPTGASAATAAVRRGDVMLVAAVGGDGDGADDLLIAVAPRTGEIRWQASAQRVLLATSAPLLLDGDTLSGLHPRDGTQLWRRTIPGALPYAVAVGDRVLVSATASWPYTPGDRVEVAVVDARDGVKTLGLQAFDPAAWTSPRAHGPVLVRDRDRVALVSADGATWSAAVPEGGCCGGHLIDDDTVTLQLTRDRLLTLERRTGARLGVTALPRVGDENTPGWLHGSIRISPTENGRRLRIHDLVTGALRASLPRTQLRAEQVAGGDVLLALPGRVLLLRDTPGRTGLPNDRGRPQ